MKDCGWGHEKESELRREWKVYRSKKRKRRKEK